MAAQDSSFDIVSKLIRDEGPKGVRAQVQGEELRVSAKKKDDLQAVIALLKGKEFGEADPGTPQVAVEFLAVLHDEGFDLLVEVLG